jgi:hypothetical protein
VLDEVTTFARLAKDGAYMAGDRRVHHTERSRWRLTFRRLAGDALAALPAAGRSTACRCAATGVSIMRSTWSRSPRSGTSAARARAYYDKKIAAIVMSAMVLSASSVGRQAMTAACRLRDQGDRRRGCIQKLRAIPPGSRLDSVTLGSGSGTPAPYRLTHSLTTLIESGRRESNPHGQLGRLVTRS